MRQVLGISYPRSGHNIIHEIFSRYYQKELIYCDAFNISGAHCGCRSVPCVNTDNTFSKNHDFGLATGSGLPIVENASYFIQYRTPVRSITSNFKVHSSKKRIKYDRLGFVGEKYWRHYASSKIDRWKSFVNKWVIGLQDSSIDRFNCSYQTLLEAPMRTARKAIQFTSLQPVDEVKLRNILKKVDPRPLDNLRDFPFVNEKFFANLESRVRVEMEILGLPSWENGY